jgi:hypothetical protein
VVVDDGYVIGGSNFNMIFCCSQLRRADLQVLIFLVFVISYNISLFSNILSWQCQYIILY